MPVALTVISPPSTGLPKKSVLREPSRDAVTRTVAVAALVIISGEIQRHFELGQDVPLDIERDLGRVAGAGFRSVHQGAEMVCAEVHFIGEAKIREGDARICPSAQPS